MNTDIKLYEQLKKMLSASPILKDRIVLSFKENIKLKNRIGKDEDLVQDLADQCLDQFNNTSVLVEKENFKMDAIEDMPREEAEDLLMEAREANEDKVLDILN